MQDALKQSTDSENTLFTLASEVVKYTSCNLFLTGKAGTGKTTFLKFIKEQAQKNAVIVAPTGVAAINAGGVTMHSFFQLPFNLYLPAETTIFGNNTTVDKFSLLKNIRFNRDKIELINELELLIIDEVSMVRADSLQAIDDILRHVRRNPNKPFGGVQVLLIGDLFQLPPVVAEPEWELMKRGYESPFFFSAPVLREHPPLFIELKKIYRQSETAFINLLNNIRNNTITEEDLILLRDKYQPAAPETDKHVITLTTHNRMAEQINQRELQKLDTRSYSFAGNIEGDFSDKALPTDLELNLKAGAQVMFIKNDSNPEKRYFNGRLATVKHISTDNIEVIFNDNDRSFTLEKEKWTNIRYTLNKETNKLEEDELGSFTQYPVRLAWAITIHKSQGLTFDKVVIDAGSSFAAGQVYVALSRCRTLDGIRLLSPINRQSVHSDERIINFASQENSLAEIEKRLAEEKPKFAAQLLLKTFDWSKLLMALDHYIELIGSKKLTEQDTLKGVVAGLMERAKKQQAVADKFTTQLSQILALSQIDEMVLNERVTKAKAYFSKIIHEELINPVNGLQAFFKGKTKVKQLARATDELETVLWKKLNEVQRITFGEFTFEIPMIERKEQPKAATAKAEKGSTKLQTLAFYRQGMTVEEIAKQRGFAVGTIEGHLSEFVASGEVNVFDFITKQILDEVRAAVEKAGSDSYTRIKQEVSDSITFMHIRMACNYLKKDNALRNEST